MARLELEERERAVWAAAKQSQAAAVPAGLARGWSDALLRRRAELSTLQSRRLREQAHAAKHAVTGAQEVADATRRLEGLQGLSAAVRAL
eukprot:6447830-Prymnesium_polylepis.2